MKPGERILLRNLAQVVSSPLPRFDPDYEVVAPPQVKSPPKVDESNPISMAAIHQSNRVLLNEMCDKMTEKFNKELKIRDDYMNQIALKINACAATLIAILERLSEYDARICDVEAEVGSHDTPAQRRERMLRDVVLLVDGLKLGDKETHEHRVVAFLNEKFYHPQNREFLPMDISCAYSVSKA